jgi:hypothetical protein
MGYPETVQYESRIQRAGTITTPANLAATATQWVGYALLSPVQATRLKFIVTTAVTASTTAPQIAVIRRPTLGSTSGAITLATMTIPSGATVGQVYYLDVAYGAAASPNAPASSFYMNAGEEMSLEVVTQATGSAAGAGYIVCEYEQVRDQAANQTNMVAASNQLAE